MNILFYDPATPSPYTDLSLHHRAIRGTESTVVRIAHALQKDHKVYVAQHCRSTCDNRVREGVNYISFETAHQLSPDVVILLRYHELLEKVAIRFPEAKRFLWLHNLPPTDLYKQRNALLKHQYQIIAVSDFHRRKIERRLGGKWYQRLFYRTDWQTPIPVHTIYNPIDNQLNVDDTLVNPNKLIFSSSPYKGLPLVLKAFTTLRKTFPDYQLFIISPDHLDQIKNLPPNTHLLGALPPYLLHQHIREAFCVFYPQFERVETFGLVYAEANAIGTPVLAHDFGAAREVLSDPDQLVDGRNSQAIIDKMKAWRKKRPTVRGKEEFRLDNVIQSWLKLFNQA